MIKSFEVGALHSWIRQLIKSAEADEKFDVSWFLPTMYSPVSIVGGWADGFFPNVNADLFCMSKSEPTKAMCIKICENNGGPYQILPRTDFDSLKMPFGTNDVDDTSITLEWEDDPKAMAEFFKAEWERIMERYEVN